VFHVFCKRDFTRKREIDDAQRLSSLAPSIWRGGCLYKRRDRRKSSSAVICYVVFRFRFAHISVLCFQEAVLRPAPYSRIYPVYLAHRLSYS